MLRRTLIGALVLSVLVAAAGVTLVCTPRAGSFGWVAYAPLAHSTYIPPDLLWVVWAPRVGMLLLALGAGATGAAITALTLTRSR